MAIKDITGERFGRLVALKHVGSENNRALWMCVCDCGKVVVTSGFKDHEQTARNAEVEQCRR